MTTEDVMFRQLDPVSYRRWKKIYDKIKAVQKRCDKNSAEGRILVKEANALVKEMQDFFKRRPK